MKILCWNVQGAKKFQLRLEVGFINRIIRPDILILLEIMVNEQNAELIIRNWVSLTTDSHRESLLWDLVSMESN